MNQTTDSGADPVTRQLALLENEGEPGLRSDFSDDEVLKSSQNYLGEFKADHYLVIKDHLEIPNSESFLYHTRYIPKETPVASMAIIHGFGDHSYRHLPLAEFIAEHNFEVHLIDLRGFGYSSGSRSDTNLTEMHRDVETLLKVIRPDLPLFLMGHSMGCAILSSLLGMNPGLNVAGVIFLSGLFSMPEGHEMPYAKLHFLKLLSKDLGVIPSSSIC